jgi:hypothetical protein
MNTRVDREHGINSANAQGRQQIRARQVIVVGAAAIATVALLTAARPGVAESVVASNPVQLMDHATGLPGLAGSGFAADDPTDPGWSPPADPGSSFPTNPGWSSQSDPGWNASPGWDFQPSP